MRSDFWRALGKAESVSESLLMVLEARNIPVPDDFRAEIAECARLDQLRAWLRRAAVADTIEDVLAQAPSGVGDDEHAEMIIRLGAWLLADGYAGRVLARPGVRLREDIGLSPDVVVRRTPRTFRKEWIGADEVLLIVEIVLPGPVELHRNLKSVEYARAGVPHFWRVERDGPATVRMFNLGAESGGRPAYVPQTVVPLEDLLVGAVPLLES